MIKTSKYRKYVYRIQMHGIRIIILLYILFLNSPQLLESGGKGFNTYLKMMMNYLNLICVKVYTKQIIGQ